MNPENDLIQNLFRQEFAKMVAVIGKLFGLEHIEIAEDIVSDTFLQAAETWKEKIPPNPAAWLYHVAKQKTYSYFRRQKIFNDKIAPLLKAGNKTPIAAEEPDFSIQNIKDSQLQMMFAICNPIIASESQIGLALRILCGFGIEEIAEAFLTQKETINKRLFRAKEKLREGQIRLELPSSAEIPARLENVLRIIYLLFNEGYHSATKNDILQRDLCFEALRLGLMLTDYPGTDLPKTNALVALMCFHASRFAARQDAGQGPILYDRQDESLWNKELIAQGCIYFERSAQGSTLSTYHLEAGIAFWHAHKEDTREKWKNILALYDQLQQMNYSPIVELNRLYALSKAIGRKAALIETEKLQLTNNHYYFTLLGELYSGENDRKAKENFERAMTLAKTERDKKTIEGKIKDLASGRTNHA